MRQLTSMSQELFSFFWLFVAAVLLCWCLAGSCVFWEAMSLGSQSTFRVGFFVHICIVSTQLTQLWWAPLQSAQSLWELYQECWKIKKKFKKNEMKGCVQKFDGWGTLIVFNCNHHVLTQIRQGWRMTTSSSSLSDISTTSIVNKNAWIKVQYDYFLNYFIIYWHERGKPPLLHFLSWCCCSIFVSSPLPFSSSSSTSSSRPQLFSSPVPTWPRPGAGTRGEAALVCLVMELQWSHSGYAFASSSGKGYVSHGTSAFWMISLAVSITCVISTKVSSIFSAVIRPWGNDAAKPHLSPAFLERVKLELPW